MIGFVSVSALFFGTFRSFHFFAFFGLLHIQTMEKSIVVAEDRPRTDSTAVSLSARPFVKINSISIDLLNANDKGDAEKCDHFSIRGYVSQIRKINKKICWPFATDGNDSKSEGAACSLPPLDVQKFRWWRCKNCLQDIVAGCEIKDNEVVSCPCGFKSNFTCSHVSSLDTVKTPLDFQQAPYFIERGKFDHANTSANIYMSDSDPLSRGKGKERECEVEYNTLMGHGNYLTDSNQENATPTNSTAAKVNPCNTREKHTNGTVSPKSKCSGPVGVFEAATIVDEELNDASSDRDEIKPHGAPLRKFRKVRLLAELLGENGVARADCMRKSGSCSNTASDASARPGTVSILQGPVAVQGGNARRSFMGQSRKRKLPRDEEWRPPATSYLKNVNMKVMASEDAETDSEEDVVVGASLHCSLTEHRIERDSTSVRRKNKKTRVIDLNKSQCEIGDSSEGEDTNDALLSSVHDAFTDRGVDSFPLHAQLVKRNSNLFENKSKVDDELAPILTLLDATPIAGPIAGKDMEVKETEILTVPIQPTQQAPTGKKRNLSLNSYLSVSRYDEIYNPLARGGLPSSSPWHGGINQGMRKTIETDFIGDSRVLSKSALNEGYGNGVSVDMSRKGVMYKMPFLNDKHKHSYQVEDGVGSLMQQMSLSNPISNRKTIEDQELLAVTKGHTSQRADKISELGTSDDIPMEIVELMAKNQYERCLHDGEREKQRPETMNNRIGQMLDFTGGYGNKEIISLQDDVTRKQKTRARNGRDGIRITGDYVGPTKHKFCENSSSESQFHPPSLSRHDSPQNWLWSGNRARLGGLKSSNGFMQPLSACNTCQAQPQHSKQAAGLQASTIPNQPPFGFNSSQSTDAEMPSRRVSSLQKRNMNGDHATKFINANSANHGQHHKNLGSDTLVRTHPDYPFACKHKAEPPKRTMGSLDLYSNETIPAMHLLSLMDAGACSGASISTEETQKLLKRRPLFPQGHHSQEFPVQQLGPSREYFPAIEIGGASTSSFQQNRNFSSFAGQASLKYPQKAKTKTHGIIPPQIGCWKSHKFALASGGSGRNHVVSSYGSEQMFLGDMHPPSFPFQSHLIGNASRKQKPDANVSVGKVWPMKINLETEICSVNRNPADFSIPGARNGYMIRGEDLKFRKRFPAKGGSAHYKHQKNAKLTATKECAQQRIPCEFSQ